MLLHKVPKHARGLSRQRREPRTLLPSSSARCTGSRVKGPTPSLLWALPTTEISATTSPDLCRPTEFPEGELQAKLYMPAPPFLAILLVF